MKPTFLQCLTFAFALGVGALNPPQAAAQTISYTGGTITENFDSMGPSGTNAPPGWFVGYAGPTSLNDVGLSDGSIVPNGTAGWNFGASGAADRALGTMATSVGSAAPNDSRYLEARISNNSVQPFTNLTVHYDGEQWRTGQGNTPNTLVLQVSADGVSFVNLGAAFDFLQPTFPPFNSALDGNQATNRAPGRGGTFALASPLPPGGTLFLRWYDRNDSETDPALAIDNFSFSVSTNPPPQPSIVLANVTPINGPPGTNVNATALPDDFSGVTRVDFYLDGQLFFTDTASPYAVTYGDLTAGSHTLTAVAYTPGGLSATSAPVTVTMTTETGYTSLVSNGSVWKYLDNGTDPGTAWRTLEFDDSGWNAGAGELGFGDRGDNPPRPERTVINGGPATNRIVTTYFRNAFHVSDPGAYSNLVVRLLRDDGGVVYLNGVEVFRSNIDSTNPIVFTTLASNAGDDGTTYFSSANLSPALLVAGQNVLAVEIHQGAVNSSDLSFDAMLLAQVKATGAVTTLGPFSDYKEEFTFAGGIIGGVGSTLTKVYLVTGPGLVPITPTTPCNQPSPNCNLCTVSDYAGWSSPLGNPGYTPVRAAANSYLTFSDSNTFVFTTIYGVDSSSTNCPLCITGFDPTHVPVVISNETVIGKSGALYRASLSVTSTLSQLSILLGPGFDLSPFLGDPASLVYVFQTTVPVNEISVGPAITIRHGRNLIANPVDSGANTLNEVLPNVPEGWQLYKWDQAAGLFHRYIFDAFAGWVDENGDPSAATLGVYEAAFLDNPGADYQLVFNGLRRANVPPPPTLERGRLYYRGGPVNAPASYVDMTGLAPDEGALFIRWDAASQSYQTNRYIGGAWELGEPVAAIAEAVAIKTGPNGGLPEVICPNQQTFLKLRSGANSSGLLPNNAPDPQFTTAPPVMPAPNPFVLTSLPGGWLLNGPNSQWVGPVNGGGGGLGAGIYTYTNRFWLPCTNEAKLIGSYAADNSAQIWLNNIHTPNDTVATWGFSNWKQVSIISGFQQGWNELVFRVTDQGGWSGLRVELRGTYCPIPSCPPCLVFAGCPANIVVTNCPPAAGGGAVVSYNSPGVLNGCGGVVNFACTPPSLSVFPLGTTTVTCLAQDNLGNTASCSFTVTVNAGPTTTRVWNTGGTGAQAANFTVLQTPSGPANIPAVPTAVAGGSWVPNSAASSWVSYTANTTSGLLGVYHYQLKFYLPCAQGAKITGRFTADDTAGLYLNGTHIINSLGYNTWTPVNITGPFAAGSSTPNTLDIWVTNANSYTGLRTELTNSFSACCGCVSPPSDMVLWLPLDETAYGTALNKSAPPFPGSHVGAVTPGTSGYVDKSVTFPGNNTNPSGLDHVAVPSYLAIEFANSDFSFDAWIRPNNAQRVETILSKYDKVTQQGYAFYITPKLAGSTYIYTLGARFGGGIAPLDFDDLGCSVQLGAWSHVAVTVKRGVANGVVGYVNGQAGNMPAPAPAGSYGNSRPLWLGEDEASVIPPPGFPVLSDLRGEIDEVELFKRVLDPLEVEALYVAGQQGKCKTPPCVTLTCPPSINICTCGNGPVSVSLPYNAVSTCASIVSVTCVPPSPGPFPVGTTLVTCTALDSLGNMASCYFPVTVTKDVTPPVITCPGPITRLICTDSLAVDYTASGRDDCSSAVTINCVPPSGTVFNVGTTFVICTATDGCGNSSSCSFPVTIVKNYIWQTLPYGVPDCFANNNGTELATQGPCLQTAYSAPTWKNYDETTPDRWLGQRWNFPATWTIIAAQLATQVSPHPNYCGYPGSENDTISVGMPVCTPNNFPLNFRWTRSFGSGNPIPGLLNQQWCNGSGCGYPFVFDLATLSPFLLPDMNMIPKHLDLFIQDETTVDYAHLRVLRCAPTDTVAGLGAELSNARIVHGPARSWGLIRDDASTATMRATLTLGDADGVRLPLDPLALADHPGSSIRFGVGDLDSNNFPELSLSSNTNGGGEIHLDGLPADVSELELELVSGGQVVKSFRLPATAGMLLATFPPEEPILELAMANGNELLATILTGSEQGPVPVTLRVRLLGYGGGCHDASLRVTDIPQIGLQSPEVRTTLHGSLSHRTTVRFSGSDNALAEVSGGQCVVNPLYEGSDAVALNLLFDPLQEFRTVTPSPFGTFGPVPTNAVVRSIVRGLIGGEEVDVDQVEFTRVADGWDVGWSSTRIHPVRLVYWVYGPSGAHRFEAPGNSNLVVTVSELPTMTGKLGGTTPCRRQTWSKPNVLRIGGQNFEATELRILVEVESYPVTALTGLRLEAIGAESLMISGLEVGPEEYVLAAPEFTPGFLVLRWSGFGGLLEQSSSVTGPWESTPSQPGQTRGEVRVPINSANPAKFFRVRSN